MEKSKKDTQNCDQETCKEDLMMGLMAILAEEEKKANEQEKKDKA